MMRDRQIAWVPTFAPVQMQMDHADRMAWDTMVGANLKRMLGQHAHSARTAHALGVRLIAGSDAASDGVAHGLGFLAELEMMGRGGLSPLAVIHAASGAGSDRRVFGEEFGRIRPGFICRFLLTRHWPLERIANLRKHRFMIFGGAVFEAKGSESFAGM